MVAIQCLSATAFQEYIDQFVREGRSGFTAECPKCKDVYDVYYGPFMNEADARTAFAERIEADHAIGTYHSIVFTVEERFSSSPNKAAS
jgi:hypothetical protein